MTDVREWPAIVACALLLCSLSGTVGPGTADATGSADSQFAIDQSSRIDLSTASGPGGETRLYRAAAVRDSNRPAAAVNATFDADRTAAATLASAAQPATDGSTIAITRTLTRNDTDPGEVLVTVDYEVGSRISDFRSTARGDVTVVDADGFSVQKEEGWTVFYWNGRTTEPTVTFEWAVNHTVNGGEYDYVDVGEWSIVPVPYMMTYYTARDKVTIVRETRFGGEGAGQWTAFLGPHDERVTSVGNETVRLIVPEAANPRVEPSMILAELEATAARLDVGGESESVTAIVAPEPIRAGGKVSRSDFWTSDRDTLNGGVWIHEYVHTRQEYDRTDEIAWTIEGSARYYQRLYAWQHGHAEFDEFRWRLERGAPAVSLADREAWAGTEANYEKGALVIGALDAEIRRGTEGNATFQDVFRAMNAHDGGLEHEDFVDIVVATGGPSLEPFVKKYVEGAALPDAPADPYVYRVPSSKSNLAIEATNRTTVPGQGVDVRFEVTNVGSETSITPGVGFDVPAAFEVVDVRSPNGRFTPLEGDRWYGRHLEPGESRTVVARLQPTADADLGRHAVTGRTFDVGGAADEATPTVEIARPTANVTVDSTIPDGRPTTHVPTTIGVDDGVGDAIESLVWEIETPDGETIDERTANATLPFTFRTPGAYEITVRAASDPAHDVARETVDVAALAANVTIGPTGPDGRPTIYRPVSFGVDDDRAFDAFESLVWEIETPDGETIVEETSGKKLPFTFRTPGAYDVAVRPAGDSAHDIARETVEVAPLTGSVTVRGSVQPGTTIEFVVEPDGNGVVVDRYTWVIESENDGRERIERRGNTLRYYFRDPGQYEVRVYPQGDEEEPISATTIAIPDPPERTDGLHEIDSLPGFGAAAAVAALAAVVLGLGFGGRFNRR